MCTVGGCHCPCLMYKFHVLACAAGVIRWSVLGLCFGCGGLRSWGGRVLCVLVLKWWLRLMLLQQELKGLLLLVVLW